MTSHFNREAMTAHALLIEFHGTADELAQRADFETAYIGMGE